MTTGELLPVTRVTFLMPATDMNVTAHHRGLPVNGSLVDAWGRLINHSPTVPPEPTTKLIAPPEARPLAGFGTT